MNHKKSNHKAERVNIYLEIAKNVIEIIVLTITFIKSLGNWFPSSPWLYHIKGETRNGKIAKNQNDFRCNCNFIINCVIGCLVY